MAMSDSQVIIIGAGPYGLAAAAHLRAARIETRVLGRALEFWKNQMPAGMLLRSSWDASHISDPQTSWTLDQYHSQLGLAREAPIGLDRFIDYGTWFQHQVVPDLDERRVMRIHEHGGGFRLVLEDGDTLHSRRVIVATGIGSFAHKPAAFDGVPPALASHSSDHRDLSRFAGKELIVIGSGQSALESAALLNEFRADVELVVRAPGIHWLHRRPLLHHPVWRNLFFPSTDVGPPGLNQIIARPSWFKRIPLRLQGAIATRSIRPAGAAWLKPRVEGLRVKTNRTIVSAVPAGNRLSVTFDNGGRRCVDHVLLATGYRIDIVRHSFLAPELGAAIRVVNGYPELGRGFESSVPGLHFIGAPAAFSFGPLMRFVSGTAYTASTLTQHVQGDAIRGVESRRSLWLATKLPSRG